MPIEYLARGIMYLELAKKMLAAEYEARYIEADAFGARVMDEKIRHSYQVLGAGNYLLRHEAAFQTCSMEVKDKLQATVLLHDIGRFQESALGRYGLQIDHGIYGAELLEKTPMFGDITITLPIKHHGHLIDKLYADEIYLQLAEEMQAEIRKIIFLVRDADKLANFYLLTRDFKHMESLFFVEKECLDGRAKKPSAAVLADFMARRAVDKEKMRNFADQALMIMACIYDMNYRSSFVLMEKLGIQHKLWERFAKFFEETSLEGYKREIREFIAERMQPA